MQLPFLQRLVPALRIVPLMMGSQSRAGDPRASATALARALAGRDVLLVASSDLSHYEPAPVANRLDAVVVDQVSRFDDDALLERLERHENVACGGGPIVAVMRAARALGADRATVLKYARQRGRRGRQEPGRGLPLGRAHGERLMTREAPEVPRDELARRRAAAAAAHGARGDRGAPARRRLRAARGARARSAEPRGAFVTLRRRADDELRGCVGLMRSERSLARDRRRAWPSRRPREDGRFEPVTLEELPGLAIEISALGPLRPIRPEDVEVGRHGLLISLGRRRGVLLPQVPVEHGWDRETFLEHTCWKAGLPEDAWRDPAAELLGFTATVFGEDRGASGAQIRAPPATSITWPVTNSAAGRGEEEHGPHHVLDGPGVARRAPAGRAGCRLRSRRCGSPSSRIRPGDTTLTVMPKRASSSASARESAITPAFAAE